MDTVDVVQMPSLGRPFQLGMGYDLRQHKLLPGLTLRCHNSLQDNTRVIVQYDTKTVLLTSDSPENEPFTKVSASLQIAAKCGLLDAGGAGAPFMYGCTSSENLARVTLKYRATTSYRQLIMDSFTKEPYLGEMKENRATHVTVGILYGAEAHFLFERAVDPDESKQKIEGEIEGEIKRAVQDTLVSRAADGKWRAPTVGKPKIRCMFQGNFKLDSNPCTLQDALEVYKILPHMLGENGEHAVPLQVWLYPLSKLSRSHYGKITYNVRQLKESLNSRTLRAIERTNQIERKIHRLINNEGPKPVSSVHSKLQDLKQRFSRYKAGFMVELAHLLPLVYGYEKEESDLEDLLQAHEGSPYSSPAMDLWLEYRTLELDVLRTFLRQLREAGVDPREDLHVLLSNADFEHVVSFTFTALDEPDEFLTKLPNSDENSTPPEVRTWLTGGIIKSMRKTLTLFRDLRWSNSSESTKFIVSSRNNPIISHRQAIVGSEHHQLHPGACIMLYEGGSDQPVCFVPPSKPVLSATFDRSLSSVTVRLSPACAATTERTLEFKPIAEEMWETRIIHQNEVKLTELESDTEYEIRCSAVGKLKEFPVISDIISIQTSDSLVDVENDEKEISEEDDN